MNEDKFLEWVELRFADGYMLDLANAALVHAGERGSGVAGVVEFLIQEADGILYMAKIGKCILGAGESV